MPGHRDESAEFDPSADEDDDDDHVLSVNMDDWPVLGGPINLVFGRERTLLVGKNATGKSSIIESIHYARLAALRKPIVAVLGPKTFEFTFSLAKRPISYSYSWSYRKPGTDSEVDDVDVDVDEDVEHTARLEWSEVCKYVDTNEEVWRVEKGRVSLRGSSHFVMASGAGLLTLDSITDLAFPPEHSQIKKLLHGVSMVGAGVPRTTAARKVAMLVRDYEYALAKGAQVKGRDSERIDRVLNLAKYFLRWYEMDRELFDATAEILRRLGVLSEIVVEIQDFEEDGRRQHGQVFVDGVDLGLLSDGSLRLIETVVYLVRPASTVLLLEEPETGIHPGLLRKLLSEIEAYSTIQQIVMSTHSPIVVNWSKPGDVRLVERSLGKTTIRSLSDDELRRLSAYLNDDGDFSDFLFSGAV